MLAALLVLTVASVPEESVANFRRLDSAAAVAAALKPAKDRPRLVHFWALWCPPCLEELPRQIELARKLRDSAVDVLFVSVDEPENEVAIRSHLHTLGGFGVAAQVQMNSAIDAEKVATLIQPRWDGSLPATFVIHPNGKTVLSVIGAMTAKDEKRISDTLKLSVSAKRPVVPLAPARRNP